MVYAAKLWKEQLGYYHAEMIAYVEKSEDREAAEESFFYFKKRLQRYRSTFSWMEEDPGSDGKLAAVARKVIDDELSAGLVGADAKDVGLSVDEITMETVGRIPLDELKKKTLAMLQIFVSLDGFL